ncbi:hypothetical protein CK222_30965 [Mesorhizobium sp. WSM3866]|nr:hypothetical protein CK222_30965 [Mesorhizobium sp. WSM3866]
MADKQIGNGGSGFEIAMVVVIVCAAMGLIVVAATAMQ